MADPLTKPPARKAAGPALHVDYEAPLVRRRRPNRLVAFLRGWADEHLSREQVGAGLRTLLWVAPLTVLIWIYAERQQLQTAEGVTLPIAVISGDHTKVVRVIRPADGNVVVKLRGPKAAMDEAIRRFNPLTGNRPAEILLDRTTSTGEQTIRALRIKDDKRLAEAGIIVDEVAPEEIRIYVDQIVTKKFPVQVADPQRFGSNQPVFTPPEVTVSGPERVMMNPANNLRLEADVAAKLNALPASDRGEVELKDVKLSLVGTDEKNITLSQPTVTAKVVPVARKTVDLPLVRLWVNAPALTTNGNTIEMPDTLSNVKVSGPADVIDKLLASDPPALPVSLPPSVISAGSGDAPIEYRLLPEGVVWEHTQKTVSVKLTPK